MKHLISHSLSPNGIVKKVIQLSCRLMAVNRPFIAGEEHGSMSREGYSSDDPVHMTVMNLQRP
jgi:hypothetical protein